MDDCTQIIKRLDDMDASLRQQMGSLAEAMTKLAVQHEKAADLERRLAKAERDLDIAHKGIRGLDREMIDRFQNTEARVKDVEQARDTCPARIYTSDQKERGKEARAIRYTLLGYIVFEAFKWYLDKIGPNAPPIGGAP